MLQKQKSAYAKRICKKKMPNSGGNLLTRVLNLKNTDCTCLNDDGCFVKRFVEGFNLVTLEILPLNCLSAEVPDCVKNSAFDKKSPKYTKH